MKNTQEFVHGKRCYELELPGISDSARVVQPYFLVKYLATLIHLKQMKNGTKCYTFEHLKRRPNSDNFRIPLPCLKRSIIGK